MNKVEQPLISVITIVYNGEKHLQKAINSIKEQTYKNIEYIVIDGGSTDNSLDIIKSNNDIISYYISEPDKGISDAFNKGIAKANGNIIGLLNSDDMYEANALEEVVNAYINNAHTEGIYYGNIRYFDEIHSFELIPEIKNIWKYMSLFHPAVFVSQDVYNKIGSFSLEYKYAMDAEFIHRCLVSNISFIHIDSTLANFRLEGLSNINYKESFKEFYKSTKTYGNYPYAYFYYVLGVSKKRILNSKVGDYINKYRYLLSPFMSGKYKKS
mgnify:CR=1 FL=1